MEVKVFEIRAADGTVLAEAPVIVHDERALEVYAGAFKASDGVLMSFAPNIEALLVAACGPANEKYSLTRMLALLVNEPPHPDDVEAMPADAELISMPYNSGA